jgi:hypothetical protein
LTVLARKLGFDPDLLKDGSRQWSSTDEFNTTLHAAMFQELAPAKVRV